MKRVLILIIIGIIIVVGGYFLIFSQNADSDVGIDDNIRCSWKPEIGPCKAIHPRFYFDSDENTCKQFNWGGCDGTVPFETIDTCESVCR